MLISFHDSTTLFYPSSNITFETKISCCICKHLIVNETNVITRQLFAIVINFNLWKMLFDWPFCSQRKLSSFKFAYFMIKQSFHANSFSSEFNPFFFLLICPSWVAAVEPRKASLSLSAKKKETSKIADILLHGAQICMKMCCWLWHTPVVHFQFRPFQQTYARKTLFLPWNGSVRSNWWKGGSRKITFKLKTFITLSFWMKMPNRP